MEAELCHAVKSLFGASNEVVAAFRAMLGSSAWTKFGTIFRWCFHLWLAAPKNITALVSPKTQECLCRVNIRPRQQWRIMTRQYSWFCSTWIAVVNSYCSSCSYVIFLVVDFWQAKIDVQHLSASNPKEPRFLDLEPPPRHVIAWKWLGR